MASMLERQLLVVTGKGGVGKTTIAAAIGLLAAERGLRAIIVEVGEQSRLARLFARAQPRPGVEGELQDGLWSVSIDPDRALLEWLQVLGGRIPGRVLASSGTFQYFAAAAPGAKELVSMVKIWELTQGASGRRRGRGYDLVLLDAPATGHALGMLTAPHTFGAIARVGPIAAQTQRVAELLGDPARTDYLAVALGTEMAVTETIELQQGLRRQLGRELHAVIVNGVMPRRFTEQELQRLAAAARDGVEDELTRSAARAARAVHDRARFQHNQIARLRRRSFQVLPVPFQFSAELDLSSVRRIAVGLGHKL